MTLTDWLSLTTICILGAMSPGPSLVVILKNTLAGGRSAGIKTALGHGFGVGVYAYATATGLVAVLARSPVAFVVIQWLGAFFLAYLGFKAFLGGGAIAKATSIEKKAAYNGNGFKAGFLIAFLNPKLAVFFGALFSQFVSAQAPLGVKIIMSLTAASIDTCWYLVVVVVLSNAKFIHILSDFARPLDKILGLFLILLAVRLFILNCF